MFASDRLGNIKKMIKVAQPFVGTEEVKAVTKVLLSGRYVSGTMVEEFERRFAEYIGTKYAVAVNSGTAALHLALAILDIRVNDEVIVPPLTFFSTISAVFHQAATPVFSDVNLENYCIDPKSIKSQISNRTKAIIPVHLYGNSADMDSIIKIAKKYKLKVIEDAAQAHGTEYKGRKVGSIGDIGCFSFFATKHMTTGEGGMIVTNNKKWANLAKIMRNHGMTDRCRHDYLGYNYRMTEIAAVMGIAQLKKLDRLNTKRIKNSFYLINRLNTFNISWLKTPKLSKHIKHTFFWCPILIDEEKLGMNTKNLIKILAQKNIETRHRYWQPLYRQKMLTRMKKGYSGVYLRNSEKIAGRIIGLPNHAGLTKKDLDYTVRTLKDIRYAVNNKEGKCVF